MFLPPGGTIVLAIIPSSSHFEHSWTPWVIPINPARLHGPNLSVSSVLVHHVLVTCQLTSHWPTSCPISLDSHQRCTSAVIGDVPAVSLDPLGALETLGPEAPMTLTNPFGWNLTWAVQGFSASNLWTVGSPCNRSLLRTRRIALRMTPNWNTCCTSWATLNGRSMDAGSLQVTHPPLSRRPQRAPMLLWNTLAQLWAQEIPQWCRIYQLEDIRIFNKIINEFMDYTHMMSDQSHFYPKRRRGMFSTALYMHSLTRNSWRRSWACLWNNSGNFGELLDILCSELQYEPYGAWQQKCTCNLQRTLQTEPEQQTEAPAALMQQLHKTVPIWMLIMMSQGLKLQQLL